MNSVTISVCIPTYNQADYINLSVRSVMEQTIPPQEVIISNDCSTDHTDQVLASLLQEFPLLTIINQPINLGMIRNTDFCLRRAKGDYVVKLDSDDYIAGQFIEKLANALDNNPSAGYAHAAVREIDEGGNFTNVRQLARKSGFIDASNALQAAINGYKVAANIIMFRREALEKVGYIQNPVNFAEDYFLSAAIASAGYGNVYINEVLSYYRVWSDAGMVRQKRKLAEIMGIRSVFENVLEPAFHQRGWRVKDIMRKRLHFAIAQSDALGWNIYTEEEKEEIKEELYRLAAIPSMRLKLVMWMYQQQYGFILNRLKNVINFSKSQLKTALRKSRAFGKSGNAAGTLSS